MKTKCPGSGRITKKHTGFVPLILLITVNFGTQVSAQGIGEITLTAHDSILLLQAENAKTRRRTFFVVGQTIRYKIRSSKKFEKGLITGITDSTISFQNRNNQNRTLSIKDLVAFRIPRSTLRKVAASLIIRNGMIALIGAGDVGKIPANDFVKIPPDESKIDHAFGIMVGLMGLAQIGVGTALLNGKKMDLEKSWKLTTRKGRNKVSAVRIGSTYIAFPLGN